ncbi:asparagine synthetase B family protein [Bacillus pseudomycoides]|uniref:asparagine synthase-related protein n=1 Tax=Bacillus pseudomycoides TaxID=64104 RepID=UPI0023DB8C96|nr:asparagine synthetase B family protein [Bacillus pseudomycoides]MDF2084799.1 asparagine synthase-related protein [Bacillus pseudomycoides]
MKIWVVMNSRNKSTWKSWTNNISSWLDDSLISYKETAQEEVSMAEFTYRYETYKGVNIQKEKLNVPFVMDGWLKSSRSTNISTEEREELYQYAGGNLDKLLSGGDFTFSIWNKESKSLIFCSDLYGTRPIYYWVSPHKELFVSNDLRALLHINHIPFEIDYEHCFLHLTSQYAMGEKNFEEDTFFKGIKKIPAATIAEWKLGKLKSTKYWGMEDLLKLPMIQKDYVQKFRDAMIESVNDRLYHSTSILEISGGLDSAGVLAAAIAGGNKHKVLGVNISFSSDDMVQSNDRGIVRKLLTDLQIPGIIILGDNTLKIANAEIGRDPLWYIDGPDPRANVLINEMYNAIANEFKTDFGLTGEGGDFLFSGDEYVLDSLIRQRKFKEMLQTTWDWSDHKLGKAIQLGAIYGIAPFIPVLNDKLYYKLAWSDGEYEMPKYFTHTHRERENKAKKDDYKRYLNSKPLKYWGSRFHYDYTWPRASYLDAIGISMQNMHPFYDRRMIELSFSVPMEQHFNLERGKEENYFGTKMLIRKAFTDILPSYIYNRVTKTSYAHMARKSLMNERSNLLNLFDHSEEVILDHLEIIDKKKFWEHLLGMLIRSSDINNDLGMSFQYLSMVVQMEIWLREMSKGKNHVLERAKPCKPRWLSDIEIIGENQGFENLKSLG